jgi:hypothetical protein
VFGFSDLTRQFATDLAGRVNSGLNLLIFLSAFTIQAGVGVIITWFTPPGAPFSPTGHQVALAIVFALQVAGWLWFVMNRRPDDL